MNIALLNSKGWLPSWLRESEVDGSRALIGCPPLLESTGLKLRTVGVQGTL